MDDLAMLLPDGRTLAYTDCGASSGPLVFYFHGAPSSRLDLVGLDDVFRSLGVRVVSPDRPGYGGSTPQPGRHLADWPHDVAALADHLDAERFAVMGVSTGGPYSVACAALLPARVAACGVVCGVTDMGWPGAWDDYLPDEAALMRLGSEDAAAAWCEEHYGADGSGFLGGDMPLAPADLEFLAEGTAGSGFVTSIAEAFRQGIRGFAQDITVQGEPWSFDPVAITAPVLVLHGEADTLVPVAHARHTAELMPGSRLVTFPHHGHLSLLSELPQLAADLAAVV